MFPTMKYILIILSFGGRGGSKGLLGEWAPEKQDLNWYRGGMGKEIFIGNLRYIQTPFHHEPSPSFPYHSLPLPSPPQKTVRLHFFVFFSMFCGGGGIADRAVPPTPPPFFLVYLDCPPLVLAATNSFAVWLLTSPSTEPTLRSTFSPSVLPSPPSLRRPSTGHIRVSPWRHSPQSK